MAFASEVMLQGSQLGLHVCCIGLKGDWPALCKLGNLQRHYGRESTVSESVGICHLCRAGQPNHPFHVFDYEKMKASRSDVAPWDKPSDLTLIIPQSRDPKITPMFFKIDLFHTGHKGVMADVAANSIETTLCIICFVSAILFVALANLFKLHRVSNSGMFGFSHALA